MKEVFIAISILAGLGLVFGLGLAIAAKLLYVKVDTRVEDITGILPNANCGACGYHYLCFWDGYLRPGGLHRI